MLLQVVHRRREFAARDMAVHRREDAATSAPPAPAAAGLLPYAVASVPAKACDHLLHLFRMSGGAVTEDGPDPDYRFTLANERTFLAWIRTALALVAGGVAVVQLIPEFAFPGARHVIGILLVSTGGVLAVSSVRRWRQVQDAMRRDADLPPTRIPLLLGTGLAGLTVFVLALLVVTAGRT
jgi:putative membrane protein